MYEKGDIVRILETPVGLSAYTRTIGEIGKVVDVNYYEDAPNSVKVDVGQLLPYWYDETSVEPATLKANQKTGW